MTRRLAVIAVALLTLSACDKNTPNATPTANTSLGATPTAQPTGTATGQVSPKPSVTTAPPTGPRIVYFRIKVKPSCPSSGPGVSYPGNPIKLEWEVAGGPTAVTIDIDGGLFSTYPTTDTQEFPFTCTGPSNSTQKHTYTIKTVGGGPVQKQDIVGEAHVN
jgi:hypothetical protein